MGFHDALMSCATRSFLVCVNYMPFLGWPLWQCFAKSFSLTFLWLLDKIARLFNLIYICDGVSFACSAACQSNKSLQFLLLLLLFAPAAGANQVQVGVCESQQKCCTYFAHKVVTRFAVDVQPIVA